MYPLTLLLTKKRKKVEDHKDSLHIIIIIIKMEILTSTIFCVRATGLSLSLWPSDNC